MSTKLTNPETLEGPGIHSGKKHRKLVESVRDAVADTSALAAARADRKSKTNDPKGGAEKGSPKGNYSSDRKAAHETVSLRKDSKPKPTSGQPTKVDGGSLS